MPRLSIIDHMKVWWMFTQEDYSSNLQFNAWDSKRFDALIFFFFFHKMVHVIPSFYIYQNKLLNILWQNNHHAVTGNLKPLQMLVMCKSKYNNNLL